MLVPSVALGQAIGRWGNFFNSEAFGLPTNLPWSSTIPMAQRPVTFWSDRLPSHVSLRVPVEPGGLRPAAAVLPQRQPRPHEAAGRGPELRLPDGLQRGRFWIEGLRLDPLCLFSQPPFCRGACAWPS